MEKILILANTLITKNHYDDKRDGICFYTTEQHMSEAYLTDLVMDKCCGINYHDLLKEIVKCYINVYPYLLPCLVKHDAFGTIRISHHNEKRKCQEVSIEVPTRQNIENALSLLPSIFAIIQHGHPSSQYEIIPEEE